jgi:hypothetical protein
MSPTAARSRKVNKTRMLVVDDEPDNLDLLYRTFRRECNVLRAESGHEALKVLEEHGEVAVIISDQRMPEMKGTEFLSRTVPAGRAAPRPRGRSPGGSCQPLKSPSVRKAYPYTIAGDRPRLGHQAPPLDPVN